MNPTAKMISDAIDVFEETGWTKQTLVDSKNQVCSLGALEVARNMAHLREPHRTTDHVLTYRKAVDLVGEAMADILGNHKNTPVAAMNDSPQTTQEDVLLSFKHALHKAEEL